jgi:lysozyme
VDDEPSGEDLAGAARRRRWPFIAGGVVIVLAAVGLWGWFGWLPNYRPNLEDGERYGVDVSNHQGEVDWERVAGDDMEFAYIKASEGGDFVDEWFDRNWEGAGAAGLDRGAYHFFTLCRPGHEQAANFLDVVPLDPDALPPVVDLELAGNCADRPDREWVERELGAFLDAVESATGETVVLYVGDDFEGEYHLRDELDRPIWHRRVLLRPDVEGWWIWQVQGYASIDGIDGGADLNVMRGERPQE